MPETNAPHLKSDLVVYTYNPRLRSPHALQHHEGAVLKSRDGARKVIVRVCNAIRGEFAIRIGRQDTPVLVFKQAPSRRLLEDTLAVLHRHNSSAHVTVMPTPEPKVGRRRRKK